MNTWTQGNIHELVSIFKEKHENPNSLLDISIFLGAGADISSGGVSFNEFKKHFCVNYSDKKISELTSDEKINSIFNEIFTRNIYENSRSILIKQLLSELGALEPSDSYKLLVLLSSTMVINSIITTNFDNMLERAEKLLNKNIFQCFGPGLAKPYPQNKTIKHSKTPYLKIHGDLSIGSEIKITENDLILKEYDSDLIEYFKYLINSHVLIFCGYGGYDEKLISYLNSSLLDKVRIFWCNTSPPDINSPIYKVLTSRNFKYIDTSFDNFIKKVAKPILSPPRNIIYSPIVIKDLFEWRLEHYKNNYFSEHLPISQLSKQSVIISRNEPENQINQFLFSSEPLSIITGMSGVGKSILGINIYNSIKKQFNYNFLFIKSKALDKPDIISCIGDMLGCIGSESSIYIQELENWLILNQQKLIIFLDALNEYSADINSIISLFRNIIKTILILKPNSPIKFIITIRSEVWRRILPHVDQHALEKLLWGQDSSNKLFSTIQMDEFNEHELNSAIKLLDSINKANTLKLWPNAKSILKDPFIFSLILQNHYNSGINTSIHRIMEFSLELKLSKCSNIIHPILLKSIFSNIALNCLISGQMDFSLSDYVKGIDLHALEEALIDISLISRTERGQLRFQHDRYYEHFLSKCFGFAQSPDITIIENLREYLIKYENFPIAIAAAKLFYLSDIENSKNIACILNYIHNNNPGLESQKILYDFCREVLLDLIDHDINLAISIIDDFLPIDRIINLNEHELRGLILLIGHLPYETVSHLLFRIINNTDCLASHEAEIFILDELCEEFLLNLLSKPNLMCDNPYKLYFNDKSVKPWQSLTRIFEFISRFGPANLSVSELKIFQQVIDETFKYFDKNNNINFDDVNHIKHYILKYSNRLFFNATADEIVQFYKNDKRLEFLNVFCELEKGNILNEKLYNIFIPYIRRIGNNCEFHLSKLAFILSSINNFESTLRFWENKFMEFNNSSSPEEVDFLQATLPYLFVVNNVSYDNRFDKYFEKILKDFPSILTYTPGLIRGQWRNISDSFDLVFEDGFNPIASYIYLKPSNNRIKNDYVKYRNIPIYEEYKEYALFTKYLTKYIEIDEISKALRIIHAIGSHIMMWPKEGLNYLAIISENTNPSIRRAYIRILTECYHRYPLLTMQYIKKYGANLSDKETKDIRLIVDPQLGYRQIEDLEWANVAYYFINKCINSGNLFTKIKKIIQSENINEALSNLIM